MEAKCPVCNRGDIRKEPGGFHCAHIDATRKGLECDPKAEIWNLVPSCATCNESYGTMCMFDYMAHSTPRREGIKRLAFVKVRSHLRGGYKSALSPDTAKLLKYKANNAPLDFASFIRDTYHAKLVDDATLSYRDLLRVSSTEERDLLSGFQ